MLGKRSWLTLWLLVCFVAPWGAFAAPQAKKPAADKTKTGAAKATTTKKKTTTRRRPAARVRGQQAIHKDRVRDIQTALIREGYLTGKADGAWDDRTQKALSRYQEDNGWQSKVVPDSRALIKLGLGPNHAGLLNPESIQNGSAAGPAEDTPQ